MTTCSWRSLIAPLSIVFSAGCGEGDLVVPPDGPPLIEIAEGNPQVGTAGFPLEEPVAVRLVDPARQGIPDRAVTWVVSGGGGRTNPQTSMTDEDGIASTTWTLGPSPGPNTLEAVVSDVGVVTLTAMGAGGNDGGSTAPSPTLSTLSVDPAVIVAGGGQTTITVVVRDGSGRPVEGAIVVFAATGEGNVLTQPGVTDARGTATGSLRSTVAGTKVVSATVNGTVVLTQTAQVVVTTTSATRRMELVRGSNQRAPAGSALSVRPTVRVTDNSGTPVSGVEVTFVITGGAGSVSGATQVTGSDGTASVGNWTLSSSPGQNTLEARAAGVEGSPVVFTAEGTPLELEIDRLIFLQAPPREVREDQVFTLKVALVDANGDIVPLSGVFIYLDLMPAGTDISTNRYLRGERFENTENGVATLDVHVIDRKDRYRIRALTDDLPALGPHGPEPWLFSEVFEVR
jgi:hypothetical protein